MKELDKPIGRVWRRSRLQRFLASTVWCLAATLAALTLIAIAARYAVTFRDVSPLAEWYVSTGEWRGRAGGYAIQGLAGAFVISLQGSYSSVVGLPLYETLNLLTGLGLRRP